MTINLQKDQKINLSKDHPGITVYGVGLGWNPADTGQTFDLDAGAFICAYDASGNPCLIDDPDFVYFNCLKSPCGGVAHSGDNLTGEGDGDDEVLTVDLNKLDPRAEEISFVVAIYDAVSRKQYFGKVKDAYIRIFDKSDPSNVIAKFDLSDDYSMDTSVQFGSLYKKDGQWRFNAIGKGFKPDPSKGLDGSFADFVKYYGGHLA